MGSDPTTIAYFDTPFLRWNSGMLGLAGMPGLAAGAKG